MVTKYDHEHIIFQAVYIQTISMPSGVFKPYAFTFQSGYIQMGNVYKCIVCKNLYIPIWLYSNDYAMRYDLVLDVLYIPIWLYSNCTHNPSLSRTLLPLHSNLVIFKSVKIINQYQVISLYIPTWLYSNGNAIPTPILLEYFTFQPGYIQIVWVII